MGTVVPAWDDPGLHAAGVEIGARVTVQPKGPPQLRIVFRIGIREASVTCVHMAVYTGPLDTLPPHADLARSSERHPVDLAPEEHFFALKSYVAGITEVGLGAMFIMAREAGNLPVGVNAQMQQQILQALTRVAPADSSNFCLWILEDASQTGRDVGRDTGFETSIKIMLAGSKDTPPTILARLAGDEDIRLQILTVRNKNWINCSPEFLMLLLGNANMFFRRRLTEHLNASPELLVRLARDEDLRVRLLVVENKNTPDELLVRLAGDENTHVRARVANIKNVPVEVLVKLARDYDPCVRKVVAHNKNIPPEFMTILTKDPEKEVRMAATANVNLDARDKAMLHNVRDFMTIIQKDKV